MGQVTLPRWQPCPYMVKTFKNIFYRTRSPMILKLGMQHRTLKVYKVYINDDPVMTLTYLMARSNLATYAFKCLKLLRSNLKGKLAANDQIYRQGVVCHCRRAINMYVTIIFKHFFLLNSLFNQSQV